MSKTDENLHPLIPGAELTIVPLDEHHNLYGSIKLKQLHVPGVATRNILIEFYRS